MMALGLVHPLGVLAVQLTVQPGERRQSPEQRGHQVADDTGHECHRGYLKPQAVEEGVEVHQ
jgi:hypothetical protein